MKRGRTDWELGQDVEPTVEQNVPPSTATVMLDSAQEARYGAGKSAEFFTGYNGLVSKTTSAFEAGPIATDTDFPKANTTLTNTGNNVPGLERTAVADAGKFGAQVNAMTGCERTRYHGSFHDAMEWDTHRGNTILSIRMFIEPNATNEETSKKFIKDFFIRIPDGFVFSGQYNEEVEELQIMLDFMLDRKTYATSYGPHNEGWNQPCLTVAGDVAASDYCKPTGAPNTFHTPIRCILTPERKLALKMDTSNGVVWTDEYVNSNSTFIVYDHPNSLTNRGGFFSGFGYLNPNRVDTRIRRAAFEGGVIPRYTTYPLHGALVPHSELPPSDFIDTVSGEISDLFFSLYKARTYSYFTRLDDPSAVTPWPRPLLAKAPFGGAPNVYAAPRKPALKDSRFFVHASDEIIFDRKLTSMFDKSMLNAGASGGNAAFGIDYREYETSATAINGPSGRFRESLYDGAKFNPAINLSSNTSLIRLEVITYNEYGEEMISDPAGNSPQVRNLVPGESFVPVPASVNFISYLDYIYPTEKMIRPINATSPRLRSVNVPTMTMVGPSAPYRLPTSLDLLNIKRETQVVGLKNYFDNGARMGGRASNVHFLQNEIY
jgi:hypothetical protein